MELKQIVNITITAVIAITIVMVMAVPILQDSADAYTEFANDGIFEYGIFTPDDEYRMDYNISTGEITVNDAVVTPISGIGPGSGFSYSVIATEKLLFRFGHDLNGYYMQIIGKSYTDTAIITGGVRGTAVISDGMLDINLVKSDGSTQNIKSDFAEMYAIVADDAPAVMKLRNSPAYILGDSEIFATGLTTVSHWYDAFHIEGTYADGITISSPNLDATFSNVVWNITPVSGYKNLYTLDSLEFDITVDGSTVHTTYSYFGVPAEISAEKNIHTTGAESALISIIPMVLIVVIILAVVGSIALRRND